MPSVFFRKYTYPLVIFVTTRVFILTSDLLNNIFIAKNAPKAQKNAQNCSRKSNHLFVNNHSSFWYIRRSPISHSKRRQSVSRLSHATPSPALNF